MCEHNNDPGGREAAMVSIAPGVHCDPCLVPLIKALHESTSLPRGGTIATVASCCGHGRVPGSVILADDRVLTILPDLETYHAEEALLRNEGVGMWSGQSLAEWVATKGCPNE